MSGYAVINYPKFHKNGVSYFDASSKGKLQSLSTTNCSECSFREILLCNYLGVYIDCHLTWHDHIDYICCKI